MPWFGEVGGLYKEGSEADVSARREGGVDLTSVVKRAKAEREVWRVKYELDRDSISRLMDRSSESGTQLVWAGERQRLLPRGRGPGVDPIDRNFTSPFRHVRPPVPHSTVHGASTAEIEVEM